MAPGPPPAVSWLHAYPPLLLLACSAMSQPAGRLLGASPVYSVLLRTSPILRALDALVLVVQCLVSCAVLRVTPRQALLIIGTDRYADNSGDGDGDGDSDKDQHIEEMQGQKNMRADVRRLAGLLMAATATRLVGFFLGVLALVNLIVFESGGMEARWTAAWGWMFVGAYVLAEAAAQVYQRERTRPRYTPVDFELREVSESPAAEARGGRKNDGDDVDVDHAGGELSCPESVTGSIRGEASAKSEESDNPLAQRKGDDDSVNSDDDDSYDGSTLEPASTSQSTVVATARPNTARLDLEAARTTDTPVGNGDNAHPYKYSSDISADVQSLRLNTAFSHLQTACLVCGGILHAGLVYWAFLDLIQISVNKHVLAVDFSDTANPWKIVTDWNWSLWILGIPFLFVALVFSMAVGLGVGVLIFAIFAGIREAIIANLPPSTRDHTGGWAKMIITGSSYVLGGLSLITSCLALSPIIGKIVLSPHMQWIWKMLSFETVVCLMVLLASFLVYLCLKGVTFIIKSISEESGGGRGQGVQWQGQQQQQQRVREFRKYLQADVLALISLVLITLVLSIAWYSRRFARSAHWVQDWRDALVANVSSDD